MVDVGAVSRCGEGKRPFVVCTSQNYLASCPGILGSQDYPGRSGYLSRNILGSGPGILWTSQDILGEARHTLGEGATQRSD